MKNKMKKLVYPLSQHFWDTHFGLESFKKGIFKGFFFRHSPLNENVTNKLRVEHVYIGAKHYSVFFLQIVKVYFVEI